MLEASVKDTKESKYRVCFEKAYGNDMVVGVGQRVVLRVASVPGAGAAAGAMVGRTRGHSSADRTLIPEQIIHWQNSDNSPDFGTSAVSGST
eukprot:s4358_g3.t1